VLPEAAFQRCYVHFLMVLGSHRQPICSGMDAIAGER
jgi:transposase-like protein